MKQHVSFWFRVLRVQGSRFRVLMERRVCTNDCSDAAFKVLAMLSKLALNGWGLREIGSYVLLPHISIKDGL